MRVLVWDIDGTLLEVPSAGKRSFEAAFAALFGKKPEWGDVHFGGTTDLWIAGRMLELNGLSTDLSTRHDLLEAYADIYERDAAALPLVLKPHVPEVLAWAARLDYRQVVLTGNMARIGWFKLRRAELNPYIDLGVFGDEDASRSRLGELLLDRLGKGYTARELAIIGDTGNDVRCAQHIGAVSIAVETGKHSATTLAGLDPDARLANLSGLKEFLKPVKL